MRRHARFSVHRGGGSLLLRVWRVLTDTHVHTEPFRSESVELHYCAFGGFGP